MRKMKMMAAASAALLVLSLSAFGCAQEQTEPAADPEPTVVEEPVAAPEPVTFTDDLGNTVTVDNPQRVVACMGSFANIWELAGGTLTGVSSDAYASYGVDSTKVASVGEYGAISLEGILALDPDFVILTGATAGRAGAGSQLDLQEGLTNSGIPHAYFKVTTFDDYLRMLETLTKITGRDDLYKTNGTDVQERINQVIASAQAATSGDAPKVLIGISYSQGLRVQNSATQPGDIAADLGLVNIADENPSLLKEFSMEALAEADPDYVFIIPMGEDTEAAQRAYDALMEQPAWQNLDAYKAGRCIMLDPTLFVNKPNADWDKAYQAMADALTASAN